MAADGGGPGDVLGVIGQPEIGPEVAGGGNEAVIGEGPGDLLGRRVGREVAAGVPDDPGHAGIPGRADFRQDHGFVRAVRTPHGAGAGGRPPRVFAAGFSGAVSMSELPARRAARARNPR